MNKQLLLGIALLMGCEGGIETNSSIDTTPNDKPSQEDPFIEPGDDDPTRPQDDVCQFVTPGETPLRRLTANEMNNTIQDLFPGISIPIQSFPDDEKVGAFDANILAPVDDAMAEDYQRAAENVALQVTENVGTLCADDCSTWVSNFARRAFRGQIEAERRDALVQMFEDNRQQFDEQIALRLTIEAVLQSPYVLYRVETGSGDDEVVRLTDHETATRLSYFLTGSTPDDTLLDAADAGELSNTEQLEAHARRLLDDPKTRFRINNTFMNWFGLQNVDLIETPRFSEEQKQLMKMETETFINYVLWEDDASLKTLLTADYAFVSDINAYLYDVEPDSTSMVGRVDLPDHRRGILSHPSWLAEYGKGSAVVHRGSFIADAFLCVQTPDPPDELEELPTYEGEPERSKANKRIEAVSQGCSTCHVVGDNLGLVFDQYNANGVYVGSDEFDNPVTSDGHVYGLGELDGPVNGIPELVEKLAAAPEVRTCVSNQFLGYALARTTGDKDDCSLLVMDQALENSDGSLTEMLISVVKTDAFRFRTKLNGGEQ